MNRREFATAIGGAAAGRMASSLDAQAIPDAALQRGRWFRKLTPGVHLDYHYPERESAMIAGARGGPMIRTIAESGAEMVVVFAKCHYGNAYYNTRVGHKHKDLGNRDLLADWVGEARRRGMVVLAYYSVDRDAYVGRNHPEWRMRDAQGRIVEEDRWPPEWAAMGFLCYNSPYRDFVKAQVTELLDYDIDGFHFDMLWFGHTGQVCYCEHCRSLFEARYQIEMPTSASWDARWRRFLDFRYESNTRFCDDITAFVRSKRPDLSVMYNYHGTPPNSWQEGMLPVKHRLSSDYGTGEGYPMRFGHHYASLMSCFLSNLQPGTPWQGVTSRYTRALNDKTVRPLADLTWETLTYVAHGGMPLFVDTPEDDGLTLDRAAYERIGHVFSEVASKRRYVGHEPIRQVGLYFSAKTRDWYGKQDAQRYLAAFTGAHRVLVESHIPVGCVFDENVTLERLREYPLIYLANVAILSQLERDLITQYVREGGRVIATGDTSRFDEDGGESQEFGLAGLFGIHFVGKCETGTNFFSAPESLSSGIGLERSVYVPGPNNIVEAHEASAYGSLKIAAHDRGPGTEVGHAPYNSPSKTVGPALTRRRFGRGEALYLPFSPETAYISSSSLPEQRVFAKNVICSALPEQRIVVSAPLNVEAVITRDRAHDRTYFVHFIGFVGVRDGQSQAASQILAPVMEEMWRYRAEVRMPQSIRRANAHSGDTMVRVDGTTVLVETGEIHDVIAITL